MASGTGPHQSAPALAPRAHGRPTVLFLAHNPPLPPISGDRLRTQGLMRELSRRGWSVSLFALGASQVEADARAQLEALCDELLLADGPSAARRVLRGRRAVLTRQAFQESFFASDEARTLLAEWLRGREFDVVVVGLLYMFGYLPAALYERAVLDSHNAELGRVRSMAASGRGLRAAAARAQLTPVARFEQDAVQAVARTVAVSTIEQAYFETLAPGRVDLVPNGIDCRALQPRSSVPADPELLFVGSLDYAVNIEGLRYLVDEVLPLVSTPRTRLTVVGSNPRRAARRIVAGSPTRVELAGRVPSTEPHFRRSRLLVVPLLAGGGTRLKILEAFARGVPVVSTTVGHEGLDVTPGEHLLVGDRPAELADAIDRALQDDELCRQLAEHGRALAERRYDWRRLGAAFEQTLLAVSGGARAAAP